MALIITTLLYPGEPHVRSRKVRPYSQYFFLEFELSTQTISYSTRALTVSDRFNLKEFGVSPNDSSWAFQCVNFGVRTLSYAALLDKTLTLKAEEANQESPNKCI